MRNAAKFAPKSEHCVALSFWFLRTSAALDNYRHAAGVTINYQRRHVSLARVASSSQNVTDQFELNIGIRYAGNDLVEQVNVLKQAMLTSRTALSPCRRRPPRRSNRPNSL